MNDYKYGREQVVGDSIRHQGWPIEFIRGVIDLLLDHSVAGGLYSRLGLGFKTTNS